MDILSIDKETVINTYKQGSKKEKKVLELLFGVETFRPKNVMDRVKTFEDACRELGKDHPFVLAYQNTNLRDPEVADDNKDVIAYLKLRIIAAALNEGWKPQFTKDEWRYYPRFELCTNMALTAKSDEWKASRHIASIEDYLGYYEYIVCTGSNTANPNITPLAGCRLCFKNADLAIYFGAQFINLWVDFCLIKK